MNIGELFLKLGFNVDDKKLRGFDSQVTNVRNSLFGAKEYALAATYAISRFIDSSVKGTSDLKSFQEQTGLSVDALQDLQNVGVQLNRGLTKEGILGGIKNLQAMITELQTFGGGDIRPFQAFGVEDVFNTDALQVIEKIRQNIGGMDDTKAVNLLKKLGLDGNWLPLLKMSNDEFDRLASSLRLTSDQLNSTDDLGRKLASFTAEISHFKDVITAEFAPSIVAAIEKIRIMGNELSDLFNRLVGLIDKLGNFKIALYGIVGVLAAVAAPFTALAAAITGFLLAMDELEKWSNGEKNVFSEIGNSDLYKKLFGDKNIIDLLDTAKSNYREGASGMRSVGAGGFLHQNTPGGVNNNQKTQNIVNTFNVHSTSDPQTLSNQLVRTFEDALKQRNNGSY